MPEASNTHEETQAIVFDLGGVLVELSGIPALLSWTDGRVTTENLWEKWLTSPAVRDFERGLCEPMEFAERLVDEMELPVSPEKFIAEFENWPRGLCVGALELVGRIPSRYVRATLSNTNVLHWPRMMDEFGLGSLFSRHFASHLTGNIKPDVDAFNHLIDSLDCEPASILFLDDNMLNVNAADRTGIQAVCVKGVGEAESVLVELGII